MYAPDLLVNKVAVITGGGSGIGLGLAHAFVAHGAKVTLLGRQESKVRAAARELNEFMDDSVAAYYAADVRDYEAVDRAMAQTAKTFGAINTVVANAAGNFQASAVNLSSKGFRTVIEIDLIGTFNTLRAGYDYVAGDGGSFFATSAPQARHPMPFQVHAAAAKAGIEMLVKNLALEWSPARIRVNGVSPGPIDGTEGAGDRMISPDRRENYVKRLPLGRFGRLDEVANAALFLASDLSSYTTGHILDCEGGLSLGEPTENTLLRQPRGTRAEDLSHPGNH